MKLLRLVLLLAAFVSSAACSSEAAPPALRFAGIPDADKHKLARQYALVAEHLARELGQPVEFVHVPDYSAAVTALAANKIDFAWLGGVTAVQAEALTAGQVEFVAARDSDLTFKSYFIARRELIDSGAVPRATSREFGALSDLTHLGEHLRGRTLTFGDKLSTSGHLLPRQFLEQAGVELERALARPVAHQLQGGHAATLQAVASGAFDFGVLNFNAWEKADEALQQAAPIVAVTPPFVDYCWVAHARLGSERIARLRAAFVGLKRSDPREAAVLDVFAAKHFVPADARDWEPIRNAYAAARRRELGN